jgi:hypothetical protein
MCRRVIGELVSDDINQENALRRIEAVKSSKICHKALFCKMSADIFSERSGKKICSGIDHR